MVVVARVFRTGVQIACASRSLFKCSASHQMRFFHVSGIRATDRRYTDKHEWVTVIGNIGVIGISNYAQEALGDVVYAQLPEPGTVLGAHQECGALESVKAASEVYSPVSGTVTEKNTDVEDSPALINSNCYDKGWLFKVTLADPKEVDKLMSEEQYKQFLKSDADTH